MGKQKDEPTEGLAVVLESPSGETQVILEDDERFGPLSAAIGSELDFSSPWFMPSLAGHGGTVRRLSPYQLLVQKGRFGLRDLLVPSHTDFDEIIKRINWYANTVVWVTRALSLRAALDAAEFNIFVPRNEEQLVWLEKLCRDLRMYSVVREIFWNLRAYDQAIILWKTGRAGEEAESKRPVSMECQDLTIVQPKGPGHIPRLYMYPHKDKIIKMLAGLDKRRVDYRKLAPLYPPILIEAAKKQEAVDVKDLEDYGYHFEYISRNRRDWDDYAFPTMYGIFADLELLALASEIDANALHHYKAGILQFAIGPENPTSLEVVPTEKTLRETEAVLKRQLQNRLATLFTRGDCVVRWVVPPVEILTEDKYKAALRRVFDYLGFPKVAWAGQDVEGAYAAAVTAFKFLRAESEDDRAILKEFMESWLTDRAKGSNQFKGAQPVRVRFDPNALVDDQIILEFMRLFMQSGGASLSTVLDMADLDPEFEAHQRKQLKEIKKAYDIDFGPEFSVTTGAIPGANPAGGRPRQGERPRSEEDTGRQPRASKATVEALARKLDVSPDYILDALREVGEENADK